MTTRTSTKDPGEIVTLEFDFAAFGTPSSPDITVDVHRGTDANPDAVRLGSATVSGTKVLQQMTAGVSGVDYWVRCYASVGSDRPLIDMIVPVRSRPTAA